MSLGIQRPNGNPAAAASQGGGDGWQVGVGPTVRLSVTHGLKQYDVAVPAQISIGTCNHVGRLLLGCGYWLLVTGYWLGF